MTEEQAATESQTIMAQIAEIERSRDIQGN
jgi:hypothetical protein